MMKHADPPITITKNDIRQDIRDILENKRRQWGEFRHIEARTPREFAVLENDLRLYIEEYNRQAEQEATHREYQWTIDAYIHCRVGDAYMATFQHLLSTGEFDVNPQDTMERLTAKPTVWQWKVQQRREDSIRRIEARRQRELKQMASQMTVQTPDKIETENS